jgi:hypothetical protein
MEVMGFIHGLDRDREEVDTGDVCRDLSTVLTRRHPEEMEALHQRIVPALIAYSATHNEFGKAWRNRVMEPPRTAIRAILRRGIERGLLKHSLNIEHSIAMLLGPVLYVHIFPGEARLTKDDIGPAAAEAFCQAFAIEKKKPGGKKKAKAKR